MAKKNKLSEEFLKELFNVAGKSKQLVGIISEHLKETHLPDSDYIDIFKTIKAHWAKYKDVISVGGLIEKHKDNDDIVLLIDQISKTDYIGMHDALVDELENFIKKAATINFYEKLGQNWKKRMHDEALGSITQHAEWLNGFSLKSTSFTEIMDDKEYGESHERYKQKAKEVVEGDSYQPRFYIDELDQLNDGRSLRGQLTAFLAISGVGKSRILKHIGLRSALDDGFVLHIQLEGSSEEATTAYQGAMIGVNAYHVQKGNLSEHQIDLAADKILDSDGSLKVKTFPKFGSNISTNDVKNAIEDFKKNSGYYPDVLVLDYVDLIATDATGRNWKVNEERHKRIKVLEDLKDLAGEYNIAIFTAVQSNIVDTALTNDPNFVFTEYNSGESKGIVRPLSWLITLNRTYEEFQQNIMRLHIAKTRFTSGKGDTIKIATDFAREIFYDREASLNL